MDIFSVLSLFGGIAMFLYGMDVMGKSLERQAGNRLQSILEKLTSSRIKGFLLGLFTTAVIQSSAATTVMVVGFINSGIMKLAQACGVIMGANVGTTVTAWILSLTSITGESLFIKLLKPASWTPILALVGIILYMFVKKDNKKNLGSILLGFAILMFGMNTMTDAFAPLADEAWFADLFTIFSNPLLGILIGVVLTAIVQSSSATIGILQALCMTGAITYASAIPILMGQNVGSCVTVLISSIGANRNARRASLIHLFFNIIGVALFMTVYLLADALIGLPINDRQATAVGIAIIHTGFNLANTAVQLPIAQYLEKLVCLVVRDAEDPDALEKLDERLLNTPSIATEQCLHMTMDMARTAREALTKSVHLLGQYTPEAGEEIVRQEDRLDRYEDMLGSYLVKLSGCTLSEPNSKEVSLLLHMIGDFERIGDHSLNLMEVAQELHDKKLSFSEDAQREIIVLTEAIDKVLALAMDAFETGDISLARRVEPLEQVVDDLTKELRTRHIDRLKEGRCTIELGFILSDFINNCERVADHCSNIAASLIETSMSSFEMHNYTDNISSSDLFQMYYKEYRDRYSIAAN